MNTRSGSIGIENVKTGATRVAKTAGKTKKLAQKIRGGRKQ